MKERKNEETQNETTPCISADNLLPLSPRSQDAVLGTGTFDGNNDRSSSVHFVPSSIISSTFDNTYSYENNNGKKNICLKIWLIKAYFSL